MKSSRAPSPSSPSEAYGAFAYAYDQALGARFFQAARALLDELNERFPASTRTHLDVACGTGLAVAHFRARGWESVGVDASLAMLQVARARAPRVVAADFRALPFRRRFARVTCLYDSLNHLLDRNDLVAAFRSMRAVMDDHSLLLFDMNHPDVYPAVWGIAEPFVAEDARSRLEIATSYDPRSQTGRAMVRGWAMVEGARVPIREEHRQRAYSEREIVTALGEADLSPIEVLEFDPYQDAESGEPEVVKMFFVCRAT